MREDFNDVVINNWVATPSIQDKPKILTKKYKNLRSLIKAWSSNLSNLKSTINNISLTIQLLDFLEEFRDLSLEEWNFRGILREKLLSLLEQQRDILETKGCYQMGYFGRCRN